MLISLAIRDVVLIEELDLNFQLGLCVLTGETGAGKSILLDALGLAMGARGDSSLVRSGAEKAQVTAEFSIKRNDTIQAILHEQEMILDDDSLILRRVITADGKGKCFVNNQVVTLNFLKSLASQLVDVHGQFDALLDANTHLSILDKFAKIEKDNMVAAHGEWKASLKAYAEHEQLLKNSQEREAFLRYSLEDFAKLSPKDGEESKLTEEKASLSYRAKISDAAEEANASLNSDTLIRAIAQTQRALDRASEYLPGKISPIIEMLERASVEIGEADFSISQILSESRGDSNSLETIDDRIHGLRALAKKHNADADGLETLRIKFEAELENIDNGEMVLKELERSVLEAKAKFKAEAGKITAQRLAKSEVLAKLVMAELAPLKLENASFRVRVEELPEDAWSRDGVDFVRFEVSTNPGTPFGVIDKIASGGELSRFMLALKVVLAEVSGAPTLVFDEIDSGTGGAVAAAIGSRLKRLSNKIQVLSITHSPQVAGQSDQHLQVRKSVKDGKTKTHVYELTTEQRKEEIARMLSGEQITNEARAQADILMKAG